MCNLRGGAWGVPGERPTAISEVSGVVLVRHVSRCVVPVAVWGIPMGMPSRVPVCRWVMRMAVVMGYRVGYMPLVVTWDSLMLGSRAQSQPVKTVSLVLSVMEGAWPVPATVVMMWVGARPSIMMGCPWWGNLLWAVLGKRTKIIAAVAAIWPFLL